MFLVFLWPNQALALRRMMRVSTNVAATSRRSFSSTPSLNQEKDHYVTLSLPRSATKGQVKQRFYEVGIVCFTNCMKALIQTFIDYTQLDIAFVVTFVTRTPFSVV